MGRRSFTRTVRIAAALAAAAAVAAPPANATWPGEANGRIVFSGLHAGAFGLFSMQPDGSDMRQIVSGHVSGASVAPHGGQVVFTIGNRVALVGMDGSGLTMLTDGSTYPYAPSWSPDGTRIVFSANRYNPYSYGYGSDIYAIDVDGTHLTQVTNTVDLHEGAPVWSPDGTRIAFTSPTWTPVAPDAPGYPGYSFDIYTMKPDGSDRVRLTKDGGFNSSPDWAPDGSRLAFARGHNGGTFIATMAKDGTDVQDLGYSGDAPVYSPDGRTIAFSRPLPYPAWTYGISVVPAGGGAFTDLTSGGTVAHEPSWQPAENVAYPEPVVPGPPAVVAPPGPPATPKPGLDIAAAHRAFVASVAGNALRRMQKLGLAGLLKGIVLRESVPAPGVLQIDVFGRAPGATAAAARAKVLATGKGTAKTAGPVKVKVKPTKSGRTALRKAKRKLKVWVRVTYAPKGLKKITSRAKPLTLKRKR